MSDGVCQNCGEIAEVYNACPCGCHLLVCDHCEKHIRWNVAARTEGETP